jgi:DNA-binding NarL/FixJ family response regulator
VIAEASNERELITLVDSLQPDLVVMDISMPNLGGIETAIEARRLAPRTKLLMLMVDGDKESVKQALLSGAEGYLLKEEPGEVICDALLALQQGHRYLSPLLSSHLTDILVDLSVDMDREYKHILTPREKQVLRLIGEGRSNREIAHFLFISVRTVETHRANLKKKLQIRRNADLIKYAIVKGYTRVLSFGLPFLLFWCF